MQCAFAIDFGPSKQSDAELYRMLTGAAIGPQAMSAELEQGTGVHWVAELHALTYMFFLLMDWPHNKVIASPSLYPLA